MTTNSGCVRTFTLDFNLGVASETLIRLENKKLSINQAKFLLGVFATTTLLIGQTPKTLHDFSSTHPPFDPNGTFIGNFSGFTEGGVSGQQATGSATESGSADLVPNLEPIEFFDISAYSHLSLTARLLPGNSAPSIYVTLYDSSQNIRLWEFPTSGFNEATFTASPLALSQGRSGTPDFNFAAISEIVVGGSGSGSLPFHVQFDQLSAVVIPEPSSYALAGVGLLCLTLMHAREQRRLRGRS